MKNTILQFALKKRINVLCLRHIYIYIYILQAVLNNKSEDIKKIHKTEYSVVLFDEEF